MKLEGLAKRLCIYIGESDQWHHKQLATAIVDRCKEHGLAGATVLRGVMGYGANSRIHTAHILDISTDLPLLIEIIDSAEKVNAFLPIVDEMVSEGLISIETVEVHKYVSSAKKEEKSS